VLRRLRARRQDGAFLSALSISLRFSHGTEPKIGVDNRKNGRLEDSFQIPVT
jgi:hypothetical protein